MDRLYLKCALMDLMEHDLVILESQADVAAVVAAAQKLGYEASTYPRSSEKANDTSWVVTTRPRRETSVVSRQAPSSQPSQVSVEVGGR
ncbi:MAG TPA: hypothetical protein VFH67_02830 [bacterium]|nr:hypothetical protein [bacterium]